MEEIQQQRKNIAIQRIEVGFREQSHPHKIAVTIADRISSFKPIADETEQFVEGKELGPNDISPTVDRLRRARKVAEVIEDETGLNVGHGKFAQAASTAGTLTSAVSIVIAADHLLHASNTLVEEYNMVEEVEKIDENTYDLFFRSVCIFVLECFLFTTPLNYRVAWKGTRYVNNQYLYRLRGLSTPLYRLILSEVHYLIRGIVPATLRSSIDDVAQFLVWTGENTLEILDEYADLNTRELLEEAKEAIEGFIEVLRNVYEVPASLLAEINLSDIYSKVIEAYDQDLLSEAEDIIHGIIDELSIDDLPI